MSTEKAECGAEYCPYGTASREHCASCQDVPPWYFDEPGFEDVKDEKTGQWEREYKNE